MKESVQEAKVEEGVNDPHIFKAVFLAGGPGSGKSFVSKNILGGTGLKTMNSDDVYEILMKKQDLALDPDTIASPQGQEIRDKAKLMTKRRSVNWIDGRLGLLIDGTGKDVAKYQKQAEFLRMLGYDVAMIFVNTSEEVAQQRNRQRARSLKPEMVSAMWNDVQQNLMKFQQIFGAGRFHIIDNSGGLEDLDRQKNFDKVYNETQRFLNTPPSKPKAKQWIQNQKAQNDATQRSERTTTNNTDSDGGVGTTN
jgi:dephospho-CoA kinase